MAPHQHGGSGGTGRCWLSRAGLSRAGLSFARPSFAGPSRAGAVGSRKPSVAAAAQPKHLLGSGQTSSGGRSQLHLTALASGPGRPRREPGAREPPWEPPPAPPLAQPPRVPTHGRCQRPRGATVLGHRPRSGASPKVTHSSTWGCATAPPARGTRNTHVAPTVAPTVTPTVAAGAGPGGPRTPRRARLIIRPLPVPVPTSCRLSGSKSMAGQD